MGSFSLKKKRLQKKDFFASLLLKGFCPQSQNDMV